MKYYFLPLLLTFCSTVFGQTPKRDTTNLFKNLNILLMSGSSIVLQNGMINTEESKSFVTFYNDNGKPIEERFASIRDKSGIIYKYYYGKCNDFKKWEWLKFNQDKIDTIQIQQITFDNNCQVRKISWTDSTGKISDVRSLEIDNKGRQMKEVDRDSKGQTTAFVLYSYPDSSIIEKKGFFGDSTFWYHSQEHFDIKGNRIKSVSFDEKGNKSTEEDKTDYIYHRDRLAEEISYNSEGEVRSKTSYFYNSDNLVDRIVSKTMENDVDGETITIYKYRKRN